MTGQRDTKPPPVPPRDYQPSKAELEQEYDMPGADMETLRRAFFERPSNDDSDA